MTSISERIEPIEESQPPFTGVAPELEIYRARDGVFVKGVLGHRDISSTEIYTKVEPLDIRSFIDKMGFFRNVVLFWEKVDFISYIFFIHV